MEKKSVKYDVSGHANHPAYDAALNQKINNILESAIDENDAFNKIKDFINATKNKL